MSKPEVTIVLPVYNSGPHLRDCISSVLHQSFENWELIALDDASTDDSFEILHELQDPRVRILRHEVNLGPSIARNTIIGLANGDFICLLDSDDCMHRDRLLIQIQTLKNHPKIDLVGSFMNLIDKQGNYKSTVGTSKESFSVLSLLFKSSGPAHASIVGRKAWFERNPYPTQIRRGEDKFMIARAVKNRDFRYRVEVQSLYFYRDSSRNLGHVRRQSYKAEREALYAIFDSAMVRGFYICYSYFKSFLSYFRFRNS